MLHHPKNKAERRRINFKKKLKHHDHEEQVQSRLAKEAAETKEAIEALRIHGVEPEPSDIS